MGRKGLIITVLVLAGALVTLLFAISRNSRLSSRDPFDAVPANSYLILETHDLPGFLNSLTEGNGLVNDLISVTGSEDLGRRVIFLRDLTNSPALSDLTEKKGSAIAFFQAPDGTSLPLLIMNLPTLSSYKSVLKSIDEIKGSSLSELRIKNRRLHLIIYGSETDRDTVYFEYSSGLLLCSSKIDALNPEKATSDPGTGIRESVKGFSLIEKASGKNEDKIYIIHKRFGQVLKTLREDISPRLADKITKLAECSEGDIYINEDGYIISGYTSVNGAGQILGCIMNSEQARLKTPGILPSDTRLFQTVRIADSSKKPVLNKYLSDPVFEMARSISPFIGNEISLVISNLKIDSGRNSRLNVIEMSNRNMAERLIAERCGIKNDAELNENSNRNLVFFSPDDAIKTPIYIFPCSNLSSAWFPQFASESSDSLITFLDTYMITGNSRETIEGFLYSNLLNKTLINDAAYREFEKTLPSQAAYYFYCVPALLSESLQGFFEEKLAARIRSDNEFLGRIQAIGFKIASGNDMVYSTLSIKYGGESRKPSGAEWETKLDTAAATKPFFFTNHNTGAKEIFIQDFRNNIYLVNAAGRVLWKAAVNERINGQVFMIDYYNNGKNQILFAGNTYIHLIDRNGNYVEKFPVRMRSAASGPPSLFDYDGNREYRFFIPAMDRNIYCYDKSGNVVKGWKPFMTEDLITSEIQFFRVSGKDYIIAADKRNIYLLDRTGNIRLRLKEPVAKADNSEIRISFTKGPEIILSSPGGIIQRISFDGSVNKTEIRRFSEKHSFDYFDIDGDGDGEYIFIDEGILYLYESDKTEVFTRDFSSTDLEGPGLFVFSSGERKIGVSDNNKKLVYLVDKNGTIEAGFPLKGVSGFSIGKMSEKGEFRLVVGGIDNFLYNYRLDLK